MRKLNGQMRFFYDRDKNTLDDLDENERDTLERIYQFLVDYHYIGKGTLDNLKSSPLWGTTPLYAWTDDKILMSKIISESSNSDVGPKYAVIKILKPLARMSPKYYYQEVPLHQTLRDKIVVNRGSSGTIVISTRNIEVMRVFSSNSDELKDYLERLRGLNRNS
jgi:hypothetical protein